MQRDNRVRRVRVVAHCACLLGALLILATPVAASVFYRFDIVAQTGQNNIVSLGTGPSINDKGKVAYIGRYANGPSAFAWSPVGGSTDIATNFLSPNRSFGEAARINRNDEVLTWNRLLPLGLYEVRVFRAGTPNDSSVMVRAISGGQPYDLLYQNPAMNSTRVLEDNLAALPGNKDGVCDAGETCVSQIAFNAFRSNPARYLGTVTESPTNAADPGLQNEFGLNTSQSHPMMADDGRVVIRGVNASDPIQLFDYNLGAPTIIAGSAKGFTTLGAAPGITTDGEIVAFAGDRGHGPGIFLSIPNTGGQRRIVRIAGENATIQRPELGVDGARNPLYFTGIDVDSRVGIVYTPDSQGAADMSVVVSFIGTPNAASRTNPGSGKPFLFSAQKGLWTIRIDLQPELFQGVCLTHLVNGGPMPPLGGDDQLVTPAGKEPYVTAGGNGRCETENTYGTETLLARASPLPVVQVGDVIGPGGTHTVTDIAVNDPIAQANYDAALLGRVERQGDHRVVFHATIDNGAGQMIVAGDHLDSDQDGLLDHWETQGIDLDGTGTIDLDLPGMGANPFKRDLFVQLDWSADRPLPLNYNGKHRPTTGLIRRLAQYFASAPARADGIVAGVTLHVDAGSSAVDPAGQPFSRNMGVGPLVGGNTLGGGPVDVLYYGLPNSLAIPGVNAVSFDSAKSQVLWNHQRGAREFAFMHIILADHHHVIGLTDADDNVNAIQAPVLAASTFDVEVAGSFPAGRLTQKGIKIASGKGAGQMRPVSSAPTNGVNGNRILNITWPWTTVPDTTSVIVPFDRSSGEANVLYRRDGGFVPGHDLSITLGAYVNTPNTEWATATEQYETLQHEMGHLFTLTHGGVDHDAYNPTYHSIMSYSYQFCPPGDKGHDGNGNILATSASCALEHYSDNSDLVSDNWKHFDLRFSQSLGALGNSFGDNASSFGVPFPPPRELSIDEIKKFSPPLDAVAPVVQITTPIGGSAFASGPITVNATATDNVGVTRGEVLFDVNGDGKVDETTEIFVPTFTPPGTFAITLPPVSGPSGPRKIALIAYDASNNPGVAVVTINIGSVAPVSVPSLSGLTADSATTALAGVNLATGAITYQQGPAAAGTVVSQAPAAGTSHPPGTPVDLVISLGPNGVHVPDLRGLSQAAANTRLNAAGLVTGAVKAITTNDPPGVLSQFPLAGAIVASASAVELLVVAPAGAIGVPNVVGLAHAAAAASITGAGLVVGIVTQQASASVPAGQVISQSPTAGALVAAGSGVDLVESSGPGQVAVPNVIGLTQAAASAAIGGAGLATGTITPQASASVPAGSVIAQTPGAGQLVNAGSAVDLVTSTGLAAVTVPNVTGLTPSAASAALTGAGLIVGTITQASSTTVATGNVISQTPAAGQLVSGGSAVNLVLSRGPPVSVPAVTGTTQASAVSAILAAGLQVGPIFTQPSATVPAGVVLAQAPAAGAPVAAGTAISLVISSGVSALAIPALSNGWLGVLAVMVAGLAAMRMRRRRA